jgi:tetratricopeptide (TPR) repeat protein
MDDFFGQLNKIMDESKKTENVKKNYDELLDFQSINKYADLNKNNQKIQHLKKMFNLFGLMFKMYLFETTEDNNVIINYSKYDISKMNQLESDFQQLLIKKEINPFSGNKSLALLNFFLQKNDKAIEHAKKAITSFPESKRTHNFNSDEAYELLLTLYQLKNDDTNFKKTLEEKIIKSSEVQKSINDYLFMAYISLYKNDLEESEKWCNMAREIDMDNFNALSLFTHLKFMKNGFNNNSFGQFYLEQTQRQAKDDGDAYTFGIQSAAYMILRNNPEDAKFAFQNIEICKKLNSKDTGFCDKLIEKYIQATP